MASTGHDIKTDPPGVEMTVPDDQHDPDPEEPLLPGNWIHSDSDGHGEKARIELLHRMGLTGDQTLRD